MNAASAKSSQKKSGNSSNAISSRGLGVGPTPCASQDGQRGGRSGRGVAPANPSASPAKRKAPKIKDTSGPNSTASSHRFSLQLYLGNRLRVFLGSNGSLEYSVTWKLKDIGWREPIYAARWSMRPTSGQGFTGWPTPDTCAGGDGPSQRGRESPRLQSLVAWSTPQSRDGKDVASDEVLNHLMTRKGGQSSLARQLAGWSIPQVADAIKATPRSHQDSIVKQIFGETGPQSYAEIEKRAVLNPALSRWLMGYPPEWCASMVTAMQSFPRSQRSSSMPRMRRSFASILEEARANLPPP